MGDLDVISRTEKSGNGLFIVVKVVGSCHLLLCHRLESTPAQNFSALRKTPTALFALLYRQEIMNSPFSSTFTKITRMHYDQRDTS